MSAVELDAVDKNYGSVRALVGVGLSIEAGTLSRVTGPNGEGGTSIGATDEYSYNITEDPVHVHDLQATILHLMGVDHTKLTFKHQGRRYRLTDVHGEIARNNRNSVF